MEMVGSYEPFDAGLGRTEATASILRKGESDVACYTSKERFAAEREVFGKVWINVAEAAELPNPGDWVVRDIALRSVSLIIVRGKDGAIRAFHNVCSHRGMKLVWGERGRGGKFSCPYHAWTYDAQGAVTHIPDEAAFCELDRGELGLQAVACDIWEGFVFINLQRDPPQTLKAFLGPAGDVLKDAPFERFPTRVRLSSVVKANWKLGIEAQNESYHAAILHARTVGKMIATKDNPFARSISWSPLGAHRRQSVPFNPDFTLPPGRLVQTFAFMNSPQMLFGTDDTRSARFSDQPGVNPTKSNRWSNDQISLYPHFVMHVMQGGWFYHRFWPLDENTTRWEVIYHFPKVASLRQDFANQFSFAFNRDTLTEDNVAIEMQQPLLASGIAKIRFGTEEMLCRHFAAVNDAMVLPLVEAPLAAAV